MEGTIVHFVRVRVPRGHQRQDANGASSSSAPETTTAAVLRMRVRSGANGGCGWDVHVASYGTCEAWKGREDIATLKEKHTAIVGTVNYVDETNYSMRCAAAASGIIPFDISSRCGSLSPSDNCADGTPSKEGDYVPVIRENDEGGLDVSWRLGNTSYVNKLTLEKCEGVEAGEIIQGMFDELLQSRHDLTREVERKERRLELQLKDINSLLLRQETVITEHENKLIVTYERFSRLINTKKSKIREQSLELDRLRAKLSQGKQTITTSADNNYNNYALVASDDDNATDEEKEESAQRRDAARMRAAEKKSAEAPSNVRSVNTPPPARFLAGDDDSPCLALDDTQADHESLHLSDDSQPPEMRGKRQRTGIGSSSVDADSMALFGNG